MEHIKSYLESLDTIGVPREDSALGLPLGMETKIVCKHNMRNLMDMSHQRMCNRAYHEYRGYSTMYAMLWGTIRRNGNTS